MFEKIRKLFLAEKITELHLDAAISRGWITEEQKQKILHESE